MQARTLAAGACVAIAIGALACEEIAHVSDFRVDQSAPYHGLCNVCPTSAAGLRHPPCPPSSDDSDDARVHVYVLRRMNLGLSEDPKRVLDPASYDPTVGYDVDCSDRLPHGLPVLCAPNTPDAHLLVPWSPYPAGIDNALSTRVFSYLAALGAKDLGKSYVPLDVGISKNWEAGKGSILTIVYNWNGTPNDPKVSFRIISTLGTVGSAKPRWDGTDAWIGAVAGPDPNATCPGCSSAERFEIPQVNFATDDAYVANGTLIADLSSLDPANAYIVNNGASLEVSMHRLWLSGQITQDEIARWTVQALWSLADFKNARSDIANWLSGCISFVSEFLCGLLPKLADQAADMPLDPSSPASRPCDAISLSWSADAYRAHIGTYESVSAAAGCPIVCQ